LFGFADAEKEIAEKFCAAFGVVYFDVELHGVDFAQGSSSAAIRCRCGLWRKNPWEFTDVIAVAVPDTEGFRYACEEVRFAGPFVQFTFKWARPYSRRWLSLPFHQGVGDPLHAVADA